MEGVVYGLPPRAQWGGGHQGVVATKVTYFEVKCIKSTKVLPGVEGWYKVTFVYTDFPQSFMWPLLRFTSPSDPYYTNRDSLQIPEFSGSLTV